jgi:chromosome segregation ATPase
MICNIPDHQELQKKIDGINTNNPQTQLAARQQQIESLNNQIREQESKVKNLEQRIQDIREQDPNLENEILRIELEAKEAEVVNQQKNIDQLKTARENLYQQVQE